MNQLPKKKVGGSAGLAALIKQRTEIVQTAQTTGSDPSLPPMIVASVRSSMQISRGPKTSDHLIQPPSQPPTVNLQNMNLGSTSIDRSLSGSNDRSNNPPVVAAAAPPAPPAPSAHAPPPPPPPPPSAPATVAQPPAPAAPAADKPASVAASYLPKTTSFNAANKCYLCEKTVYKPEELIAVGHVWHEKCFSCGGKNSDGCRRVMKRDGYLDHNGEPYCQACFNKLFRTKGFGYGNALNTNYGETATATATAGNLASKSGDSATTTKPSDLHGRGPALPKPPFAPDTKPRGPALPKPPFAPDSKYTPTNNVTVHTTTAPKCTSCHKTVYKMEETIAVGRVWHNACFVCGGTKGDGCKKTLRRDGYVDHDNQPYCQACYNKLFKIKGFGYGNSLNTDYGPVTPATVDSAAASSAPIVVEGQGTAVTSHDNISKPKAPGRPSVAPPAHAAANVSNSPPPPPIDRPYAPAVPPPPVPPPTERPPVVIPVTDPANVKKSAAMKIGTKAGELYSEASYVGDNDEVDESEW